MIDVAILSVIRRWHLREGVPIREIARRTKLSRNTIRKYLRSDTVEPAFKVPDRPSQLDPFAPQPLSISTQSALHIPTIDSNIDVPRNQVAKEKTPQAL